MNNFLIPVATLIIMFVFVPPVFPIEISKDTVYVNDSYTCFNSSEGMDTLKLWNTVNSPVTLDSLEIIINPSQDGYFRKTDCRQPYSDTLFTSGVEIRLLSNKDTLVWIGTGRIENYFFIPPYNQLRVSATSLAITGFTSFLSFTGVDTCFIYDIIMANCFGCVGGWPNYLIDFSAKITLYYSDGSRVTFHCINDYSTEVKTRPEYHLPALKNMPDKGIFNIKGQMFHRSIGNYSPGIYLRTIGDNRREPEVLLHPNPAFDGGSGDAQ